MSSLMESAGPRVVASPSAPARVAPRRLTAAAYVEERFLVPGYSSPMAPAWIAAHRALSLPFQLKGTARHYSATLGGEELRVIGIGNPKRYAPLFRRLFGQTREVGTSTTRMLWHPVWIDGLDADLIVSEVHRWATAPFRAAGWKIMPGSIRWAGETATLPPPVPCHSLREDLRKLRRYEYRLEQTTAWRDWEEFYETMLAPQALSRFREKAWLPGQQLLRELAARGLLHYILRDGQRVAGICTVRHGDTIWLPVSGVLNGDPALLRQGVSVAVFAQIFAWARGQGVRQIDAGRTTPFMNDGIARTKTKWGLRPVLDPLSHLLALRINPNSPIRGAFTSQPVMMESADGLKAFAGV